MPVNRIVWLDKYQVHEWYPFSQQGRIGNPKSTAAVGAMLCSLALDLRLPRFNFKAADIGAYSTVRYLGVLDNTVNTLREENVWYQDIDLDKPGAKLDARLHFRYAATSPSASASWRTHAGLPRRFIRSASIRLNWRKRLPVTAC